MATPLFYFSSSSSAIPTDKDIPINFPSVSESCHEKSQYALPSVVRLSGGYCAAPFDCAEFLKPHVAALYDTWCDVDTKFKIEFPSWGLILDRRTSSMTCFLDFSKFETWLLFGPVGPTDVTGGKFFFSLSLDISFSSRSRPNIPACSNSSFRPSDISPKFCFPYFWGVHPGYT